MLVKSLAGTDVEYRLCLLRKINDGQKIKIHLVPLPQDEDIEDPNIRRESNRIVITTTPDEVGRVLLQFLP